jgi:hypothetical protein
MCKKVIKIVLKLCYTFVVNDRDGILELDNYPYEIPNENC